MPDEVTPQPASAAAEDKNPQALEKSTDEKVVAPSSEKPPQEWNYEEGMKVIHDLRSKVKMSNEERKELETLKAEKQQRTEAEMTEVQKLQKQADEAKAEAAKLKTDILRRDVIAEIGLPAIFADRLQGVTKEEMLEDAKKLKEVLPTTTKTPPHLNATDPQNANTKQTEAELREKLWGSSARLDEATIKRLGGGVVWTK